MTQCSGVYNKRGNREKRTHVCQGPNFVHPIDNIRLFMLFIDFHKLNESTKNDIVKRITIQHASFVLRINKKYYVLSSRRKILQLCCWSNRPTVIVYGYQQHVVYLIVTKNICSRQKIILFRFPNCYVSEQEIVKCRRADTAKTNNILV